MMIAINGEDYLTSKETITIIELLEERNVARPETVSGRNRGHP